MKIFLRPRHAGFALLMVLIMVGLGTVLLAGAMYRSMTVSNLNQRNNDYLAANNAAEAAVEKAYASLGWTFQSYGVSGVSNSLASFRTNIPSALEEGYWTNFVFSDAQGQLNKTYVEWVADYTGPLPSTYSGLQTVGSPIYRIVSNVRDQRSSRNVIGSAQEDVLLALIPLSNYAIFYNGNLEFSQCATMTVNGRVHANGYIAVGTSTTLNFYDGVSTTGTLTAPGLDGQSAYGTNWHTYFSNVPAYSTNVASVTVSLSTTNFDSHFLIEMPTNGEAATSAIGKQRLFNQAQIVLVITNDATGAYTNPTVIMTLQASVNGAVPGDDSAKAIYIFTNASPSRLASNLPFLDLDNKFYDRREQKTNLITDFDVGAYGAWTATNSLVQGKLPSASGIYPTILYVADKRQATVTQPGQLAVFRVRNGEVLPSNNTHGFSIATQNPLYVLGNYNIQQTSGGASSAGTTNTANTFPAALMSDSLTVLSSNWSDATSLTTTYSSSPSSFSASYDTTINAVIVTGTMPSTGTSGTTFSGGVYNLPRLLQNWGGSSIWLNTSILRLWSSTMATNQFRNPNGYSPAPVNPYYSPPTRRYNFDLNYLNPAKVPPGIPNALVPIRFGWIVPPPGVVTNTPSYN
jgi:hypothetical protein